MKVEPIDKIVEIVQDENLVNKIQERLPIMFEYAKVMGSRGGKQSPEVGVHRERALIALLIYHFGEKNIDDTDSGQTPELDVKLFDLLISIKTITGDLGGIKAFWSADETSSDAFIENYEPSCDIILVQIPDFKADRHTGNFFLIPLRVQEEILAEMGCDDYLKKLGAGTNMRGVEFLKDAMERMTRHDETASIVIPWSENIDIDFDPTAEWVRRWTEN